MEMSWQEKYEAGRQRLDDLRRQRETDPEAVSQQEVTDPCWQPGKSFSEWYANAETPASRYIDRIVDRALGMEREAG